jgi:hypothetical protein
MKKQLIIFFAILTFVGENPCFGQKANFESFLANFNSLKFPLIIQDNTDDKINEDIFTKEFGKELFSKFLKEKKESHKNNFRFYYGGKAEYKNFTLLIYQIIDTDISPAHDVIRDYLTTFNKKGIMIDKIRIGGQETEELIVNCQLDSNLTFTVTTLNGKYNLLKSKKYFIDSTGKIKHSNLNLIPLNHTPFTYFNSNSIILSSGFCGFCKDFPKSPLYRINCGLKYFC